MFKFRAGLRRSSAFVVLLGGLAACGCADAPVDSTPPGEPVSGKITVDGKPPGTYASVEFVSVADPTNKAQAGVDPSGNFSGRAPLGKCKVALKTGGNSGGGSGGPSSRPPGAGGPPPSGPPAKTGDGKSGGPPKMAGSEITAKMQDPDKSGVEVDVIKGQKLDIDFKK